MNIEKSLKDDVGKRKAAAEIIEATGRATAIEKIFK
jgi:hypothetical protein